MCVVTRGGNDQTWTKIRVSLEFPLERQLQEELSRLEAEWLSETKLWQEVQFVNDVGSSRILGLQMLPQLSIESLAPDSRLR